mgnify:CR=1 FL=1
MAEESGEVAQEEPEDQVKKTDAEILYLEVAALTGIDPQTADVLEERIERARGGRATYVITAAQNATPVFAAGWKTLLAYCLHNSAQLLVIPHRYKNPTSVWSAKAQSHDWWAKETRPYLFNRRVELNKHLVVLGDVMTQPTAKRPLEGFETISAAKSAIIGHPKLELLTIPTPGTRLPKIMTTTGAITKKNYIPSRAGKEGEFHHTFGAAVAEVVGDRFYLRQINMRRDGSFCDLLTEYDGDTRRTYRRVPALVMGDTHVEVIDPQVVKATFTDDNSMVKVLRPEQLVWHDTFDGAAKNHHERGRPFHAYARYKAGKANVEAELNRCFALIDKVTPAATKNVFVASNHNDFLREWVENTDPRRDPENCVFWAETYLAIVRSKNTAWTTAGATVEDPFAHWGRKRLRTAAQAVFLDRSQTYRIQGIEVSFHGDRGSGGNPGSRSVYDKIGSKTILGHTHAPGIQGGAYQVGTSSRLNLTYTVGQPSAWLHTHCVIYPNGKRCLLNVIEGKWRA